MNTHHSRSVHVAGLSGVRWRKSSYSSGNGACVEVAETGGIVAVRDSKDPGGPILRVRPAQWACFVSSAAEEAAAGS
ncbi:DUF397 domain-containing protein [Streptomyces orinoci]|uniref:DUF397 domain-containing protein n=1 Tax=Streptomyces orinoci TaxID=67339 RepID=A0ABV3JYB5_STRON|nr:DUF397 domain-containing protein [Streptomyces orinoci]